MRRSVTAPPLRSSVGLAACGSSSKTTETPTTTVAPVASGTPTTDTSGPTTAVTPTSAAPPPRR